MPISFSVQPEESAGALPTVADLLRHSHAHNQNRKRCAGRADKHGIVTHPPTYAEAERYAALALRARLAAHLRDPAHLDPAWAEDRAPHADIVTFLVKYLTTDRRSQAWATLDLSEDAKSHVRSVLGVEALPE